MSDTRLSKASRNFWLCRGKHPSSLEDENDVEVVLGPELEVCVEVVEVVDAVLVEVSLLMSLEARERGTGGTLGCVLELSELELRESDSCCPAALPKSAFSASRLTDDCKTSRSHEVPSVLLRIFFPDGGSSESGD